MSSHAYENPLITRYASREMAELWSAHRRISTWRRLWIALAEAERDLGLSIEQEQIEELKETVDAIDFERAAFYEKRLRHDVMAHVHTYGEAAPKARPIIHLGATSCFVTDNADLILMREALLKIRSDLVSSIDALGHFCQHWIGLPCLGYTHFQPAQLVTVGKRATLWCHELILDLKEVEHRISSIPFLGVKGTTGTQASFLALFDGDHGRVEELDRRVANAFGFTNTQIVSALCGIAESAHRFGSDLRLLAHEREVEEPFESDQIGSSAMAYKRNPMRAERMCSLARFVLAMQSPTAQTAATQWLERTLDDSAIRRLTLPQAFLGVDALLRLYLNVVPGMKVNPTVVAHHVNQELPFMATENLMMAAVKAGGDRQDLHERIRQHSLTAREQMVEHGIPKDLANRLEQDPAFQGVDLDSILKPEAFIGRSVEQVLAFIEHEVEPIRRTYPENLGKKSEVHV